MHTGVESWLLSWSTASAPVPLEGVLPPPVVVDVDQSVPGCGGCDRVEQMTAISARVCENDPRENPMKSERNGGLWQIG